MTDSLRFVKQESARLSAENARLNDELYRMRRVINAIRELQEMSEVISPETDVNELLSSILLSALQSIGVQDGSLALLDEDTGDLVFVVVYGSLSADLVGYRLKPGSGIAMWVAANNKPARVANVRSDPRFSTVVDDRFNFRTKSMVCVPLTFDGRVMGVINALNKAVGEEFDEDDVSLLMVVAYQAAYAMAKAEALAP